MGIAITCKRRLKKKKKLMALSSSQLDEDHQSVLEVHPTGRRVNSWVTTERLGYNVSFVRDFLKEKMK